MKYLVPTDFSGNAKNAVEYAAALANATHAELIYIHVVTPIGNDIHPRGNVEAEVVKAKRADAKTQLETLLIKVQTAYKGLISDYLIRTGDAVEEITKTAQNKADIIIMGTHGASGMKKFFFGSNTASVIEESAIPVLAIPENCAFVIPKKIVFATDYYDSDLSAMIILTKIAEKFNSEICIVHIVVGGVKPEAEFPALNNFLNTVIKTTGYTKTSCRVYSHETIEKGIDLVIKEEEADIFAVSTRKRNPLEKLFNKSTSKELSYGSKIPLLIFRVNESKSESIF